jgi:DNA-binding NtrC family response regulator
LRRALPEHALHGPARCWAEARDAIDRGRGRIALALLDVRFDRPPEELLGVTPESTDAEVDRARRRQGLLILGELRRRHPDLPVVLMTARDDVALDDLAEVDSAEEYTYFLDDDLLDARALKATVERVLAARSGPTVEGPVYWGRGLGVQRIRQRLEVLARGRLPVVLLGPTGTGKSLIARHVVHPRTGRKGSFISVDLSTIPRDLMAAQLFGAVRGAYTGAVVDRTGAFEAADGGTLFLDEIGNLTPEAQKMLLGALQDGAITRIGDVRERPVDVKLIVATCDDLGARVAEGSFRADLYMRLNPAAAVTLPSLAERRIDLGALVEHALRLALRRPGLRDLVAEVRARLGLGAGPVEIHLGAGAPEPKGGALVLLWPERSLRLLRAHDWPGNLREFAMAVENATLFALAEAAAAGGGERADVVQVRPKVVRDLLRVEGPRSTAGEGRTIAVALRPADTLNKVAQDCERQYFRRLWLDHDGDFGAMATLLLGDPAEARKVQLRFNQLGLKVKDLRGELT